MTTNTVKQCGECQRVSPVVNAYCYNCGRAFQTTEAIILKPKTDPGQLPPKRSTDPLPKVTRPPKRASFGIAVGLVVGVLIVAVGLGWWLLASVNPNQNAKAVASPVSVTASGKPLTNESLDSPAETKTSLTATASAPTLTRTVNSSATATAISNAANTSTATASAISTISANSTAIASNISTATAIATSNNVATVVAGLEARASDTLGAASGALDHDENTATLASYSSTRLKNCLINVSFFNPYATTEKGWDYGVLFRYTENGFYRLYVSSNNTWTLDLVTNGNSTTIVAQKPLTLDTTATGQNRIVIFVSNAKGYFYLNDKFIDTLDLSGRDTAGQIALGTGFRRGQSLNSRTTRYVDFTVYRL